MIIEGIRGNGYQGDIAIDDISFTPGCRRLGKIGTLLCFWYSLLTAPDERNIIFEQEKNTALFLYRKLHSLRGRQSETKRGKGRGLTEGGNRWH